MNGCANSCNVRFGLNVQFTLVSSESVRTLHLKIEHRLLTRVSRDLQHPELVAGALHHRSSTSESVVENRRMVDRETANLPVIEKHIFVVRLRLRISPISVVVELLLCADQPRDLP